MGSPVLPRGLHRSQLQGKGVEIPSVAQSVSAAHWAGSHLQMVLHLMTAHRTVTRAPPAPDRGGHRC